MGHGGRTSLVNPFPIGGVAGTGAKKPWWAAGAATWAEIADEERFLPGLAERAYDSADPRRNSPGAACG
jgi:hypothetical protein